MEVKRFDDGREIAGPDAVQRRNHHHFVRGMAATLLGHFDEALTYFAPIFDPGDAAFEVRTCFDSLFFLADAALAKDRPDIVEEAVSMLEATVPLPFSPALGAAVDYALAVTARHRNDADARFRAALQGPAADREFDLARVQLAYGRWLRREHRRLEAREQLRRARTIFDRLGNAPFTEDAREELRAAGEASPRRTDARWDELTPGAPDRQATRGGHDQQGDRRGHVSLPSHDRHAPVPDVPEVGRELPDPARRRHAPALKHKTTIPMSFPT
jgi:hypothetical protein